MTEFRSPNQIAAKMFSELTEEDMKYIQTVAKCEDDMIMFHHTVGRDIRNNFDLWNENNPYMRDKHPDDVSFEILKEIWRMIKNEQQ